MKPYFLYCATDSKYYNIGDEASCPAQYFERFADCPRGMGEGIQPGQLVIVGGGGLFMDNWKGRFQGLLKTNPLVFWGCGLNPRGTYIDPFWRSLITMSKLAGIRDSGLADTIDMDHVSFVPCCSCMHESLKVANLKRPPYHTVAYHHSWNIMWGAKFLSHLPSAANMDRTKEPGHAIAHIAQGRTVVTNSYHGAYWAGLLGRKVVAYRKSDDVKFLTGLRFPILHADNEEDAMMLVTNGPTPDPAESLHRLHRYTFLNMSFARKVEALIEEYQ